MSKETFKEDLQEVKRNARARGVARTLDMRAAYSSRYVDTSVAAAVSALVRDGNRVQEDMKKIGYWRYQSIDMKKR